MIKLLNVGKIDHRTTRLQSQLYVGKLTADFILEDGILKVWGNGARGFNFYETKEPYKIVQTAQEMLTQTF